jgi:hypothetical protein
MSEYGQHELPRLFRVLEDRALTHTSAGQMGRIIGEESPYGTVYEGELFYVIKIIQRKIPVVMDGPYDIFGIAQDGRHGWISYGGTMRGLFSLILEERLGTNGSET